MAKKSAVMQKWQAWKGLEQDDLVDIVAPGFRTSPAEVLAAVDFLKSWGLRSRIPHDLFGPDTVCSNSDEKRWLHFSNAIRARDSAAVWCLRGGYGAIRLLPRLAKLKRPKQAKLFLGYSDATTLHSFLLQSWGWAVLHSPLVNSAATGKCSQASLRMLKKVIFAQVNEVSFHHLKPLNAIAQTQKTLRGPVVGGNLKVVEGEIGTPFALKAKGKIIFFEEIGERGYRVDRMLKHLELSGFFRGCRAVVFGDFVGGEEPDGGNRVAAVLRRFAGEQSFAVLRGLPIGHGLRQFPLPLGTIGKLSLSDRSLRVECGWKL